jgi:arylformamidase
VLKEYDAEKCGELKEFCIASLHCRGNMGTYVNAPIHRWRGERDLADLPLERVEHVPAVVVEAVGEVAIGLEQFRGWKLEGKAVLVRTQWSRHWRTKAYFGANPHLMPEAGVLVGIDSVNIDSMSDSIRPAHTTLLRAGVPGEGGAAFPLRAYVIA